MINKKKLGQFVKKKFLFSFSLFNVHNIISLSHHERKRLMNVISLLYYFNQYFKKTLDIILVLRERNKFICSKKWKIYIFLLILLTSFYPCHIFLVSHALYICFILYLKRLNDSESLKLKRIP